MKKLVSIFLALALILSLSITAFAADPATIQLTVNGIKDHTYDVYQIYTADVYKNDDGTLVLSNVKYGLNHYPAIGGGVGDEVPEADLKDFQNSANPSNYFTTQLRNVDTPYATINKDTNDESVTLTVEPGYYMIVDTTDEDALLAGDTRSHIILKVAEATTVTSKHATISSTKKVADKNESTDGAEWEAVWEDAADYTIGDPVPFRLTCTLPATMNGYGTYPLVFHDMQAAGFDTPVISKVYIVRNNAELFATDSYTQGGNCGNDECEFGADCNFTVSIADVKALYTEAGEEFKKDDVLVVEYTSVLNDQANIGRPGNENHMFVHHPDGHTPTDAVTVLTYQLTINKVDGDDKSPLAGAEFTLTKYIKETDSWEEIDVVKESGTKFTWTGIDGGIYKLVETVTPDGYNTIADIDFVIDATHKTTWFADGNYAFEDLIAKNLDRSAVIFTDKNVEGLVDGKLEGNVENFQGVVLPETGAEGTFMLILGGAILVIMASVVMITRKKMSIYED